MDEIIKSLIDGTHTISKEMLKYKATPWCNCKPDGGNEWGPCKDCTPPIADADVPPQSHGGDLFQHSQWSALYLKTWYSELTYDRLNTIINEVVNSQLFKRIISDDIETNLRFLQLCGFLHDIGKGGDCSHPSCIGYDMYHPQKYGDRGDIHPIICKQVIMNPGERYNGQLQKLMDEIIKNYKDGDTAQVIIALCGALHWEFGKLNIPAPNGLLIDDYIKILRNEITDINTYGINLIDEICTLTKLVMSISCADIAAASNRGIPQKYNPHLEIYNNNGGPWLAYNFNEKQQFFIDQVLKEVCAEPTRARMGGKKKKRRSKKRRSKKRRSKKKAIKKKTINKKTIKKM